MKMAMRYLLALVCLFGLGKGVFAAAPSLVENNNAKNVLLDVGVSHGLPGIDLDMNNVETMATNPAYKFEVSKLQDDAGTTTAIADGLTKLSTAAGDAGTLFFYFSGHGDTNIIWPADRTMDISEIRGAIEKGRTGLSPLARLVVIFDSCMSGSLIDPLDPKHFFTMDLTPAQMSALMAEAIVNEFTRATHAKFWNKLFVFASSAADETSGAGDQGSVFTVALRKAFDEAVTANSTMGEFVQKTLSYTEGQHPVARLEPSTLSDEKMVH